MRYTRKQVLAAGLTGAAAVAAAAVPLAGVAGRGGSAAAAPGGAAVDRFTYRGRALAIHLLGDAPVLEVDGRLQPPHVFTAIRVGGRRLYASHLLPFRDEADPRTLARALVDGADLDLFRL